MSSSWREAFRLLWYMTPTQLHSPSSATLTQMLNISPCPFDRASSAAAQDGTCFGWLQAARVASRR